MRLFGWNNYQNITLVKYSRISCVLILLSGRHDAAVGYIEAFHYDVTADGTVLGRYYSESAFTSQENDKVSIDTQSLKATDFDSFTTTLDTDFSQAAQLPLTGYYYKTIGDRTAKIYISENASIRSYFTVVAVPDGVDTEAYLLSQGWIAEAEEKGECLLVLEPQNGAWGTAEEESDYVNGAISFVKSGVNANKVAVFSNFMVSYLLAMARVQAPLEACSCQSTFVIVRFS